MFGGEPLVPVEDPANEKHQEADEEQNRGDSQPVAQQIARLGAHVGRTAFDECNMPAGIVASTLAAVPLNRRGCAITVSAPVLDDDGASKRRENSRSGITFHLVGNKDKD